MLGIELAHGDEGFYLFFGAALDQIDQRLAARAAAELRDLIDLEPVAAAFVGEEENVIVRGGHEEVLDPILFLGGLSLHAAAAAALFFEAGNREALDVAAVGDGDHHVFLRDQVFDGDFAGVVHDFGAALVAEFVAQLDQFLLHHIHPLDARADEFGQEGDALGQLLDFVQQLLALEAGEPREPHIENGFGLLFRQAEGLLQFNGGDFG